MTGCCSVKELRSDSRRSARSVAGATVDDGWKRLFLGPVGANGQDRTRIDALWYRCGGVKAAQRAEIGIGRGLVLGVVAGVTLSVLAVVPGVSRLGLSMTRMEPFHGSR